MHSPPRRYSANLEEMEITVPPGHTAPPGEEIMIYAGRALPRVPSNPYPFTSRRSRSMSQGSLCGIREYATSPGSFFTEPRPSPHPPISPRRPLRTTSSHRHAYDRFTVTGHNSSQKTRQITGLDLAVTGGEMLAPPNGVEDLLYPAPRDHRRYGMTFDSTSRRLREPKGLDTFESASRGVRLSSTCSARSTFEERQSLRLPLHDCSDGEHETPSTPQARQERFSDSTTVTAYHRIAADLASPSENPLGYAGRVSDTLPRVYNQLACSPQPLPKSCTISAPPCYSYRPLSLPPSSAVVSLTEDINVDKLAPVSLGIRHRGRRERREEGKKDKDQKNPEIAKEDFPAKDPQSKRIQVTPTSAFDSDSSEGEGGKKLKRKISGFFGVLKGSPKKRDK